MSATTIGRLTAAHAGTRISIDGVEGQPEDIAHYVDRGISSVRFVGEAVAVFRASSHPVLVMGVPEPEPDAVIDITEAYTDGSIALAAVNSKRLLRVDPDRLARVIISSTYAAIAGAQADRIDLMAEHARNDAADPDAGPDDVLIAEAQADALAQVAAWLRESLAS